MNTMTEMSKDEETVKQTVTSTVLTEKHDTSVQLENIIISMMEPAQLLVQQGLSLPAV